MKNRNTKNGNMKNRNMKNRDMKTTMMQTALITAAAVMSVCVTAVSAKEFPVQPVVLEEHGDWVIADRLDEFDDPAGELFAMTTVDVTADTGEQTVQAEGTSGNASEMYPGGLPVDALNDPMAATQEFVQNMADDLSAYIDGSTGNVLADDLSAYIDENAGNVLADDLSAYIDENAGNILENSAEEAAKLMNGLMPANDDVAEASAENSEAIAAAAAPEYQVTVFYDPADCTFAFRLLCDHEPVVYDSDAELTLKFKSDGTVYESSLSADPRNSDMHLIADTGEYYDSIYYQLQHALVSGNEFKTLIYIDDAKYSFSISPTGFTEAEESLTGPSYQSAMDLYNDGAYEEAQAAFEALHDYKDSVQMAEQCATQQLQARYDSAMALYDAGDYEEAAIIFEELNDFAGSAEMLEKCSAARLQAQYDSAMALYDAGNYEEAAVIFEELNDFAGSAEMLEKCSAAGQAAAYEEAAAMMEEGRYQEAIAAFRALGDYEDAAQQIESIRHLPGFYLAAQIGETVYMGSYEQNNDLSDGDEEIEWIVLDKDGSRLLLLSKYVLDCVEFNPVNRGGGHWDESHLRVWMNRTFLKSAFAPSEIDAIQETSVVTDKNDDTFDRIFLLDRPEVGMYLPSAGDRACIPTDYAQAQGAGMENGTCSWWTRTLGTTLSGVYVISGNENENLSDAKSKDAYGTGIGLRPAMWVDAEKLAESVEICPEKVCGTLRTRAQETPVVVGKTVWFGTYEQNNDLSDGSEAIEWIVLDAQDGKALLISIAALECLPFNADKGGGKWDAGTIRTWLNSVFTDMAFSPEEQNQILNTTIVTRNNDDTQDRVFLLDRTESQEYFASTAYRRCAPSPYALAKGAATKDGTCKWYLRSRGTLLSDMEGIRSDGTEGDLYIKAEDAGIRPAIWVQLVS